ncbi:MAG: hypothetical protein H6551_04180 [Chitinophagales bacterium]|nr:hypothetical protein [Chitinophagales bacterium]
MRKPNKRTKIVLIVVSAIVLILTVVGFRVAHHYKSIVKAKLPAAIEKASEGRYKISAKRVYINLLNRSIILKDVHLWPDSTNMQKSIADSTAQRHYYDIRIPKLKVSSIMWDELVGGTGFSCGLFEITKPNIDILKLPKALSKNYAKKKRALSNNDISISDVQLLNGNIKYRIARDADTPVLNFINTNIALNNWKYDPTGDNKGRFLLSDDGIVRVDSFRYNIPKSDYRFSVNNIELNSAEHKLTALDMKLGLTISTEEYFKHAKKESEIYDIHFPTFEANNIAWETLFADKKLLIETVYLNHININVLFNRLLPDNADSKRGKYPNQLLDKLKLPIDIKTLHVNNGEIVYSEISDRTGKKGSIKFSEASGLITNITNIPELIDSNNICTVKLNGKFNTYSTIAANFRFVLGDKKGTFSVHTVLKNLQAHQINEQSKVFTMIAIKSMNMHEMTMALEGNEDYAKSKFEMRYNNMSIQILKDEQDEYGDTKKQGFLSFIANNLILFSHNPMPGKPIRTVNTYVERDSLKSFFNLIWRNLHQGVQESTIRDMNVIRLMRKNQDQVFSSKERKEEKRRNRKNKKRRKP